MAVRWHLPVNECLAVFVGVAGYDWLIDGQAAPLRALVVALVLGGIIFVVRRWLQGRPQD